jgi:acyl carrier protein
MKLAYIDTPLDKGGMMSMVDRVVQILSAILQLDESVTAGMTESSPILGSIPEFDSIAVVILIAALEDQFGFAVDDDEISAELFDTVGSLARFIERKLQLSGC